MDTTNLFEAALNLPAPWSISKIDFKPDLSGAMELHINLSFPKGSQFACPECGAKTTAYDSAPRTWRHLNFFQYKTYIHADLPRIKCKEHGVRTINVPWAREGSGFTLLFEGWIVELAKHLPVSTIADMVNEHDTRLYNWLVRSRLSPMIAFGRLLKNHWTEILNYFDYRYTNAILEGMNSIIQNIKQRARGFRNDEYFKTMIYLVCGKLDLKHNCID